MIPPEHHVDLQDRLKYKGGNKRDGMADLAAKLIDSSYQSMKTKFLADRHKHWGAKRLSRINLHYAAVDAYVSYELGHKLSVVNYGQRHLLHSVPCPNCHKGNGDGEQKRVKRRRINNFAWSSSYDPEGPDEDWEDIARATEATRQWNRHITREEAWANISQYVVDGEGWLPM